MKFCKGDHQNTLFLHVKKITEIRLFTEIPPRLLRPPDQEAVDAAEKLKRHYDRVITLWQKKHLRMRQNMIFATIRVVKSWDFAQFLSMGKEQRTAIRRYDIQFYMYARDVREPNFFRTQTELLSLSSKKCAISKTYFKIHFLFKKASFM